MTVMTRDSWSDAYQIATREDLDGELAARRRRFRLRRALGLAVGLGVLLAAFALVQHLTARDADGLWRLPVHLRFAGLGLLGLGFVLMIVGSVRSVGAGRLFVEPVDFLPRSDRAWLRAQVEEGRPVPDDRRTVVADTAHRMVAEGRYTPTYLGWALLYVGMIVSGPTPSTLIVSSVLIVWMVIRIVRGAVWARRARRWLAQHT